jgi:hypothetical protein
MAYEPTEESPEKIEEREFRLRNLRVAVAVIWLAAILVGVVAGSVPAGLATLMGGTGILILVYGAARGFKGGASLE